MGRTKKNIPAELPTEENVTTDTKEKKTTKTKKTTTKKKAVDKKTTKVAKNAIIVNGFTIASRDTRDKAFAEISQKYGVQAHTITEADKIWEDKLWVSTGSLKLDYVIRQHFSKNAADEYEPTGIKLGHGIELFGTEGAGKNAFLHTLQKSLMRKNFAVDFCDVENKLDHSWAKVLLEETYYNMGLIPPQGGAEMILASVKELFENKLTQCVGIDSSSALIPIKETEKHIEDDKQKAKIAARASLMARWIPQILPLIKDMDNNYAAILAFLSQMSVANMSGRGNPLASTASSALKHMCSLRLHLSKIKDPALTSNYNPSTELNKNGDNKIGNYHRILVVKNCFGADGMAINIPLLRSCGIDNDLELMELAIDSGVISKKSGEHVFNGEIIAKYRGKVFERIKENQQLRDALKTETFKFYNDAYAEKNFSHLENITDKEKRILEVAKEEEINPISEEE